MPFRLVLPLAAVLIAGIAPAADPPRPAFPDAVREAVNNRQIQDSDNLGDRSVRVAYREVGGDGGVLVGFDVGLGRVSNNDVPYALRPIYRDGDREWSGRPAGEPSSRRIVRTVRVVAKEGFAVGGMWVRSGSGLDRICLNYFRIRDGGLDPADRYPSDWVGESNGGREVYIDGRGRPVVGLFADAGGGQARSLGLIYARVPPAPKKPAAPGPDADKSVPPPDGPAAGGKSKLELEAEASRTPAPEEQVAVADWTSWLPYILVAVIGLAVAVVTLFVISRKDPRHAAEDGTARPVPDEAGQPLSERPALARRIDPYLPGTRTKKPRRPVAADANGSKPSSVVPPRPPKDAPQPVMGAAQAVVALPTPPPDDVPPFFLVRATYKARANRLTRIYVLEDELLVIDAGPGADVSAAAGLAAAAATGGGLIGALIGGAVGSMVADGQKPRGDVLQQKLDALDVDGLLKWATKEGNFRARYEELVGLAIDPPPPPSFWREKSKAVGTFRFRHLELGEFTFDFLSGAEIRGAIEMFRRSAGANQLYLGKGWDQATAGYLAGI